MSKCILVVEDQERHELLVGMAKLPYAVRCEEASAVTPNSTDNGERGSRLQADYAT